MPAFLLPDLGEGLTEAEIVTWHVQAGDTVTVDQPIVEVETAKAVVEVPVPFAGRVTALHGQPGDVVAVGEPPGHRGYRRPVRRAGRCHAPRPAWISPARAAMSSLATARPAGAVAVTGPRGHRRPSRHPAPPPPVPAATATAASRRLRPTAGCPLASPLIRQLARSAGVDLVTIRGSGRGGLITRADVRPGDQCWPGRAGCRPGACAGRPAGRRVRRGHPDPDSGPAQVGRGQAQPVTAGDPGRRPSGSTWTPPRCSRFARRSTLMSRRRRSASWRCCPASRSSPCAAIRSSTPGSKATRSS